MTAHSASWNQNPLLQSNTNNLDNTKSNLAHVEKKDYLCKQ